MKEGWTYKKLGEVAAFVKDGDWIESKDQSESGIRLIQTGNVGNGIFKNKDDKPHYITENTMSRLGCTEIFEGDCLVSRLPDPVGRACLIPNIGCRMITAVDCSIIRFGVDYLPQFFVGYTQSSNYRNSINNNTTGTTRKRISRKNLERIPIPVPPLAEQERIVAELDLLSGIIEKKKEQLKAYDQLAQSIFYTMFGDPIDNPKGWETKKLGELVSLITDGDWIESKDQSDNGIRLIQTGNIGSGIFIAKDDKPHFISETTFHSLGCTEVFGGDCLISRLPSPVGRACLIPKTDYRMITAVDCTIVRFRNIILPQFFINYSLSSGYQAEIDRKTTGTTRKRISRKNLEIIPVPLPPLTLQQEFAEKMEAIERQKALVRASIDETQTMFDYTMDKYFG